jgi:hypothetical protein
MCQAENKGLWTALYAFGGLKVATGLVLVILGAIFMAYTPQDCDEIAKCFTEKGAGLTWAFAHEEDCVKGMKSIDDAANLIGTILLVFGVVGAFSGVLSFLSAKKRYRAYLGVSMGIDIVMMFASIAMYFVCQISADTGKVLCQELREDAAEDGLEACWEDLIDDVCSWTDMFLTAAIMFLLMFIVEFATTIADCSTCCCCPPHDASWSPQAKMQQPGSAGGQVIGQPVEAQPQKEP